MITHAPSAMDRYKSLPSISRHIAPSLIGLTSPHESREASFLYKYQICSIITRQEAKCNKFVFYVVFDFAARSLFLNFFDYETTVFIIFFPQRFIFFCINLYKGNFTFENFRSIFTIFNRYILLHIKIK